MTTYITYKCSICRREKDIVKDDVRALPDQCTITKGCLGRLYPEGETLERTATPDIAGVTNWYARGAAKQIETVEESRSFSFSSSASGALVVAMPMSSPSDLAGFESTISLRLLQKSVSAIPYQQFTFKILVDGQMTVAGKDINGRNLRCTPTDAAEGRLNMKINGVDTGIEVEIGFNQITIHAPVLKEGDVVDIVVFSQNPVSVQTMTLTKNSTLIPSLARGSWSNISYITRRLPTGTRYYALYSIDSVAGLGAGRSQVFEVRRGSTTYSLLSTSGEPLILLAAKPYQSVDRYLNFLVPMRNTMTEFCIDSSNGKLTADTSILTEIYPPLTIATGAYISADLFTATASSLVVTDAAEERLTGKTILGPV